MNALEWLLEGTIDIPTWSAFGASIPASTI